MSTTTDWPKGVIARALTVGGATVDVIDDSAPSSGYVTHRLSARCTGEGCPYKAGGSGAYTYTFHPEMDHEEFEAATSNLKARAQTHAETCRFMPRPA